MEKWRRLAIESAKQCVRTHLMDILEPIDLDKLLESLAPASEILDRRILWLDPHGALPWERSLSHSERGDVLALVGPEGGWSDREVGLLTSSWKPEPFNALS